VELQTFNGCPKVSQCQNHNCFFKIRDFHGISVWATAYTSFYNSCYKKSSTFQNSVEHMDSHNQECINPHDDSIYPSGVKEYTEKVENIAKEFNINLNNRLFSLPNIKFQAAGTNRFAFFCEDFK